MWFRSVFLKTLRDCRVAILGWGLGIGVLAPLIFMAVTVFMPNSPEMRAEVVAITRNPALRLFAEPVDVLSPGGYATWRLSLLLPLVGIWALLVVTRTLRGEEESGALDVVLSTPQSHLRVAAEKLGAIAIALFLIGFVIAMVALAGAWGFGVDLGLPRALLFGVNTALFAMVFGALAFVISQFTRERRTAAGVTGALLGLSFILTSAARVVTDGEWLARLSPLFYFELNKPLVVGYPVNGRALLLMAAIAMGLIAFGGALFLRRDIGAPLVAPALYFRPRRSATDLPLGAWPLRSLFARSLRSTAPPTLWWSIVLACYTMLLTGLLRQLQENLTDLLRDVAASNPVYAAAIDSFTRGGNVTANLLFLNLVFTLLVVVVTAFAVSMASRWATDEEEGRLDLVLGTPNSRHRLILGRFGASAVALAVVAGSIFAGTMAAAIAVDMRLDTSRVAQATAGMVPVGLVVLAIGYLLSGWLRARATTGAATALVLASFVVTLLTPVFHWPRIVLQLSIFEQYGSPLVDGLRPSHVVGLLAVASATLIAATWRFTRKDLVQ
jgi:polyether ionophore transport system permease protein